MVGTGRSGRSLGTARKSIAAALVAATVLGCALHPYVYHDFLVIPYFAVGLSCILILQLRVLPSLRAATAVVAIALALLQLDIRLLGYARSAMAALSLFGLASLLVLGWEAIWKEAGAERVRRAFLAAAALGVGVAAVGLYIEKSFFWNMQLYDLYLYSFDSSLGAQWTFLPGQYVARHPAAQRVALLGYDLVLVAPALVYAALIDDRRRARTAFWSFLLVGPLASVCFLLFPATGPAYAFRTFPKLVVPAGEIARLLPRAVELTGPRNAMPSLHFAWVLLAYWNARGTSKWVRGFCGLLLVLTIFATLASGEHYGVDLLVAVPFALGVQALAVWISGVHEKNVARALIASLGLTAAWLVALRFGNRMFWVSPVVPWAAVVGTLAASVYPYRQITEALASGVSPRREVGAPEHTARAQTAG